MKNKIIIVAGDPNSINSEIISKVWKKINSKVSIIKIKTIDQNSSTKKLKIIDIPLKFKNVFNVSLEQSKRYILESLNLAHSLAESKNVKGLINCPINKKLLEKSQKIGVTEFLASKSKTIKGSEVMFIHNKKLSVVPLTTHIKIKDVSKKINKKLIIKKMKTLKKDYKRIFKKNPKIGVLGLNPHNAELAKGSEEVRIIYPAILQLKKKGFNIDGPISTDTLFIESYKKYDVIVGMYHDQILAPFKSLFHFDAINVTLGLKYVRVSPDHGPARDIIKKNKANHLSLLRCIKFINNLN